jgi:hypothetical protein
MSVSTGSLVHGFHEGSRSEYLAQYFFASFGTAVAVPHQEDTGIDLYCTLTERLGRLAWPRAHFTVQVKSKVAPWRFTSPESVEWLVHHPLPLFLCIVDKGPARLRVYHTNARFALWAMPPLPAQIDLFPEELEQGEFNSWLGAGSVSLSAPIIDIAIGDLVDDNRHTMLREVLTSWLDLEQRNLLCVQNGLNAFEAPYQYRTNSDDIWAGGRAGVGITRAPDLTAATAALKEQLGWLVRQYAVAGDESKAIRAMLMLRGLYVDGDASRFDNGLLQKLTERLGVSGYLFAGLDELAKRLDEMIANKGAD